MAAIENYIQIFPNFIVKIYLKVKTDFFKKEEIILSQFYLISSHQFCC